MIEELLPTAVSSAEAFDDPPGVALYPEEEAAIRDAVDKRRREFTTVRRCARAALAKVGLPPAPIVPGTRGAPNWPSGVVGSMTHCDGYRAAAVAHAHDVLTIGLDAEPDAPLPDGVGAVVTSARECQMLRALAATTTAVCWDRLLFSAKESVYKAWFPLTGRMLDFDEADVIIDPGRFTTGTFTARLLMPGPEVPWGRLTEFTGRWLARDGFVVTTIAVLTARPVTG